MHLALRDMANGRWRRDLAILLAIGAILGWLGPYGTYGCLGAPDRFAFWILRSLLVGALCLAVIKLMSATGSTASWPPMQRALAGVLIASVPNAILGFALASVFRHTPTSPLDIADLYGRVMIMTAMVGLPLHFVRRPTAPAQPALSLPAAATATKDLFARQDLPAKKDLFTKEELPARSAFLRRIPARLGTELLHIKVEDHYLRVHTRLGSDLLLLRLSDAVAELDPEFGRQVHRSYWVAQRAVAGVERDGHRARLVLTDGAKIPVSRTYLPALRKAGWL
jgi:DNA-binding LytR/AlgR family response regulator